MVRPASEWPPIAQRVRSEARLSQRLAAKRLGLLISDTAKIEVGVTAHIRRGSSHRIAK